MRKINKTFTGIIKKLLSLRGDTAEEIAKNTESIMLRLEKEGKNPLKTFNYIKKFAEFVKNNRDCNFDVNIDKKMLSDKVTLYMIEPPCGSNTFVLEGSSELLFVDCGFACFKEEMTKVFRSILNGYDKKKKSLVLTHCDTDHIGLWSIFDRIYMSEGTKNNFLMEEKGEKGFREQDEKHGPYKKIAEIITEYIPPQLKKIETFICINEKSGLRIDDVTLSVINGNGGHVPGEIMLLCEREKVIFTGDVFVNIAGYSEKQREFNKIATFLVPSVNTDSEKALLCREYITESYRGYLACPGHGRWCVL